MRKTSLFAAAMILVLAPVHARAATHALLAAGGCEDEDVPNRFRTEYRQARRHYQQLQKDGALADVTSLFGWSGDSPGAAPISTQQIDAFFERLLQPEAMGPGDQVLLHVNTHGTQGLTDPAKHELCVNDYGERGYYPVSRIREWWEKIRAVHPDARLGLIDQSCYGESSVQAFRDFPGVCVVSANQEGLQADFKQKFTVDFPLSLKRGESLQSAFEGAFDRTFAGPAKNWRQLRAQSNLPTISSVDYHAHDMLAALADPLLLAGLSDENLDNDHCGTFTDRVLGIPVEILKHCLTDVLASAFGWSFFDPVSLKAIPAGLRGPTVEAFLAELSAFQTKYPSDDLGRLWVESLELEISRDHQLSGADSTCTPGQARLEERRLRSLIPRDLKPNLRRLQRAALALSSLLADAYSGRKTELGDGFYRSASSREACTGFTL